MAGVFVTGTGTEVGKTYVAAALIRALIAAGRPVDAFKPVVSGFDPAAPDGSDPGVLLAALGHGLSPERLARMSPWRFAAPLSPPRAARLEGRPLDGRAVIAACRARLAETAGKLLLIEGAGGIMSPLDDRDSMLDLGAALGLPVVLVAGSYLGTISHTLTAVVALRSVGLPLAAVAVSETPGGMPLDETVADLTARLPGVPVEPVAWMGSAYALAGHLPPPSP